MKPYKTLLLATLLSIGFARSGLAQADDKSKPATTSPPTTNQPTVEPQAPAVQSPATNAPAPAISSEYGADGLRVNFHGAPLNLVLDYLSDAAGFIINKQTDVKGTVEVWSKQPVTKDEAVELLNSVLKKNGYGMTRSGRILTIVAMEGVKTADTATNYSPKGQRSSQRQTPPTQQNLSRSTTDPSRHRRHHYHPESKIQSSVRS